MSHPVPSLSIVIPTAGRTTLARTLDSLAPQVLETDQVLVVGDGSQPFARSLVLARPSPPWHYAEVGPTRDTGMTQRNLGMSSATGDFLCFMDDDDIFTPEALAAIRTQCIQHGNRLLMFRMIDRFGTTLWKRPEVEYANASTQMIVLPNVTGRLPRWRLNDFHFILDAVELHGEPVWRHEIVAILRPHEQEAAAAAADEST